MHREYNASTVVEHPAVAAAEAQRFLTLLDESADGFTFQCFDDNRDRGDKKLARILHGTLDEHLPALAALNKQGAGIFVCVNETDGKGRSNDNIKRVRAVFVEADQPDTPPLPVDPHISVESSPGKHHAYVLVDDMPLDQFRGVEQRLINEYGSDPQANDLARVLRLPGFLHQKVDTRKGLTGTPHRVRIVAESSAPPLPWEKLRDLIPPVADNYEQREYTETETVTDRVIDELADALKAIPAADRDLWVRMGLALKTLGEPGWELFSTWSQSCKEKYSAPDTAYRWQGFKPTRTGWRVVLKEARANWNWRPGFLRPPTREEMAITPQQAAMAKLTPRCIVEKYLWADLGQVIAPGGAGKTTMQLHEAVNIFLGRSVWGLPVENPGWVLFVTAEDSAEILQARLYQICVAMSLRPSEIKAVFGEGVLFWDVSGSEAKLIQTVDGNIRLTTLADDIVSTYLPCPPALTCMDPLVSFGASERMVNDNEQGLVLAGRRIMRGLDCCVRYTHHTGKANARDKALDQYAGRNGSSLPDGTRMTSVLQSWEPTSDPLLRPPPGCTVEPDTGIAILNRPKLSYAPTPQPYIWLKRDGFRFTHYFDQVIHPEQLAADRCDRVLEFLQDELDANRKYSRRMLDDCADTLHMQRKHLRQALATLEAAGKVIYADLPKDEQQGGRRHFLKPTTAPEY